MKQIVFFGGLILAVTIAVSMGSCVHDPLFPMDDDMDDVDTMDMDTTITGDPCDSTVVYFERDVLPLFQTNCAFSGCHNEASAQEDIILTSYENVMNSDVVEAFRLDNSDLYEVLTEDDEDKRMPPPPAYRLSSEDINTIAEWILQGATNATCDEEEECDLTMVNYSEEIVSILQGGCISCHNQSTASGGVRLDNYEQVAVVAGNGRLLGAVSWSPDYINMPFGGTQIDDCYINQIETWIDAGFPNN